MTTNSPSALDARLLSILERSFARHAGADDVIDEAELQRAMGLRSAYLSKRVFQLFDLNRDGKLQRNEFVAAAKRLITGTPLEKLSFAFQLHDHDGDGFIDRTEMSRMIAIAMAESEIVERASQPVEHLANVLFRATDSNQDGRISFDEFRAALQQQPELLRKMTVSEAIWLVPNEDLLAWVDQTRGTPPRRHYLRVLSNRWATITFVILWVTANLCILAAFVVSGVPSGFRFWMQLGRTLGTLLDFNGALILIPMMRRLLTRLRSSFLGRILPIDQSIGFHRLLGHTLFALAIAHAAAFTIAYSGGHALHPLSDLFLTTFRGATGLVLLCVFAVMWVFSLSFVRHSKRFELFYFTHLLYLAWLALAIAHAPSFLLWATVPLCGFAFEQVLRLRRRSALSHIVSSTPLRSAVTRLEIQRPAGFAFSPADYVFLRIPSIARHEWHPFTLSSAPERDALVVHVRSLGDWSSALRRRAESGASGPDTVYIDGPYGSPSAHIFRSRIAVLIGAGIGVTPFASVLESLVQRANGQSAAPSGLEKVHFFWLNRDQYSFEWFRALLADLERVDQRGLLDVHLCMTGAGVGASALGLELAREVMHASGRSDMITGLHTHTHLGRPDWDGMFGLDRSPAQKPAGGCIFLRATRARCAARAAMPAPWNVISRGEILSGSPSARRRLRYVAFACVLTSCVLACNAPQPAADEQPSRRCAGCHRPEFESTTRPPHAGVRPDTCGVCHFESSWHPSRLAHSFLLDGAHAKIACFDCHRGAAPVFEGTSKLCVDCHQDKQATANLQVQHHASFASQCETCHTTSAWKPTLPNEGPLSMLPGTTTPSASARSVPASAPLKTTARTQPAQPSRPAATSTWPKTNNAGSPVPDQVSGASPVWKRK